MRVAVVGHVEWIDFARVDRVPRSGEIVHASSTWQDAGGGGAVAAVQLAKLAGESTFFTALGDDELGRRSRERLAGMDVSVRACFREHQRRALTFLEPSGERTIATLGEKLRPRRADPLPWDELADCDAVFFVAGDADALRAARRARVVVATSRELETLVEAAVQLDAVVGSGKDVAERYPDGAIEPAPHLIVATAGSAGGTYAGGEGRTGSWQAVAVPGPVGDAYGCGDSFAAGLTFGLADTGNVDGALALAARCGAACLTGHGPYEGQLTLSG